MDIPSPSSEDSGFVLHILSVGFHHKHGPQLEFCHPPLLPGETANSCTLPEEWKNLPSLALPDGAHNYEEDNVYFVVPSLTKKERTLFCVSCYRQIDSDKLTSKPDDVTRSSVQKAIVAVSKVPMFGAIRERLSQAAQAFFDARDFGRVDILRDAFDDMRRCFVKGSTIAQMYIGLSVKDLVLRYRQKLLILFKLLLLERRVLFYMNPVSDLTNTMVTLVSLLPNILEDGLDRCASVINSKYNIRNVAGTDFVSIEKDGDSDASVDDCSDLVQQQQQQQQQQHAPDSNGQQDQQENQQHDESPSEAADASGGASGPSRLQGALMGAGSLLSSVRTNLMSRVASQRAGGGGGGSFDWHNDDLQSPFVTDDCGFPLPLFAESGIFLPYVSLNQLELLDNANVRACLIGANNMVFKENRCKFDAIVGGDQADIVVQDRQLARQLRLTGPDEIFMQDMVARVTPNVNGTDVKVDSDCSDNWLRAQFRAYLLAVLQAAKSEQLEEAADFNQNFVRALQKTLHYRIWSAHDYRLVTDGETRKHPCHGQSALGAKFNQFLTNSEQGRKVTNAVQSTGRVIEDTGKAVGGAFTNARSAMSGFFSGLSSRATSKFGGGGGAEPEAGETQADSLEQREEQHSAA